MQEVLDVVDENNTVVGKAAKDEVLKKNLIHRGAVIFLFDSKHRIFIHQRTKNKRIYPNMWNMTLGGSVVSGESFPEAANREITEEVGVKDAKLQFLFYDRYQSILDNVIACVYKLVYDGEIVIQKEEVAKGFFVSLNELENLMRKEKFCPDAIQYFNKLRSIEKL